MEDFNQLLFSGEWRESQIDDHPIVTKAFVLVTPTIKSALELIQDRIYTRRTGTVLYATPRTGKTRCAFALQRLLKAEYPHICSLLMSADAGTTTSSPSLFGDILNSDFISLPSKRSRKETLRHLLTHIPMRAEALRGNHFVLIIDEMQELTESDLKDLLVLHNRLELRNISMSTVGFAQPEILNRKAALVATKSRNLIARFLSELLVFDACTTSEGLKSILEDYDEHKFYPDGSQIAFTQFFLPLAYANGFRLANYSQELFQELYALVDSCGTNGIPMEHLTLTVQSLLLENRNIDSEAFALTPTMITDAVAASGLNEFCNTMMLA